MYKQRGCCSGVIRWKPIFILFLYISVKLDGVLFGINLGNLRAKPTEICNSKYIWFKNGYLAHRYCSIWLITVQKIYIKNLSYSDISSNNRYGHFIFGIL